MLERLKSSQVALKDPDSDASEQPGYAKNEVRALRPEFLVVISNCTHLGCVPVSRFEVAPEDLGPDWVGGFYCPCHGSRFDLAARVLAGTCPAPTNLVIPPYRFVGDDLVIIGEDSGVSA